MMIEPIDLEEYFRREERAEDVVDPQRMMRLAATLDREWDVGSRLPSLAHFVLFQPSQRQSRLGLDGHPVRDGGGIIPPADLPRRMWAGSRIRFHRPLLVGEPVVRRSRLVAAEQKVGRSGPMLFCTVEHVIRGASDDDPAIVDQHDIVYRAAHSGSTPAPRPVVVPAFEPSLSERLRVDPVTLFRYSALTLNGHRIHYDRQYAMDQEGYGGLVVHGPLLATLMLDHLERHHPERIVSEFSFRGVSPVLDGEKITVASKVDGDTALLSVSSPVGVAMAASAIFAA